MLNGVVYIRWIGGLFYAKYPQFSLGECRNSKWRFLWCFLMLQLFEFFCCCLCTITKNCRKQPRFDLFLLIFALSNQLFILFSLIHSMIFSNVLSLFAFWSFKHLVINNFFLLLYSPFEILVCKSNVSQFPWNFITFRSFHWYEFDDLRL